MKKFILVGAIFLALVSCGDGSNYDERDAATNARDTTLKNFNPALEDPNSGMADTMHMVDSSRVKDTSIKDKTSVTPKKKY